VEKVSLGPTAIVSECSPTGGEGLVSIASYLVAVYIHVNPCKETRHANACRVSPKVRFSDEQKLSRARLEYSRMMSAGTPARVDFTGRERGEIPHISRGHDCEAFTP
jgi:hypothetical protein